MRRAPAILGAMLGVSLAANVILWYRAESAQDNARFNEAVADVVGMHWGQSEAKRDFASGVLRWYQFVDSGGVPRDKSDRQLVTVDLNLEPSYLHRSTRAFVESYDRTIDEMIAKKEVVPPRMRSKR